MKRYILTFPPESVDEPIISNLVKKYDINITILNARISAGEEGHMLLGMDGSDANLEDSLNYLKSLKIKCSTVQKELFYDQIRCINCGSCTAVCFSKALHLDRSAWTLNFDPEKCTVCGLCTKACPLGLLKVDFGE
jgi:ferredoxin